MQYCGREFCRVDILCLGGGPRNIIQLLKLKIHMERNENHHGNGNEPRHLVIPARILSRSFPHPCQQMIGQAKPK